MANKTWLLVCMLLVPTLAVLAQNEPTHLKVFIKNQEAKLIPIEEIDSIRFETVEQQTNQMPLINFNYTTDRETIDAYESALGRTLQEEVNLNNDASEQPNLLPAYVNLSLDLIPIVSYGLSLRLLESDAIIALCREPIGDAPRMKALIAELGFQKTYHDEDSYHYKKDDITIIMQHWPNRKWQTRSCITIMRPTPPAPVPKSHDFITTARDLPSFDALISGSTDQIIAFERNAGYRDIPTEIGGTYLSFTTKADKLSESNIKNVFYWLDEPHISGIFATISSVDEALSDSKIHEWAKLNGFDSEWSRVVEHDDLLDVDVVYAVVSSDKAVLKIFHERKRMKFEIVPKKE